MKNQLYYPDLAFIHDAGFSNISIEASELIIKVLAEKAIRNCRVVELGCGSGILAKILSKKGFSVYGIDLSPSMIKLARKKVPEGRFVKDSLWEAIIPECKVVLSVGECLNYEVDKPITKPLMKSLFSRIYSSLKPGGIFIFDILCEGKPDEKNTKKFTEGKGWLVAVEIEETFDRIIRKIITFRKVESGYKRGTEKHFVKKHNPNDMKKILENVGFSVKALNSYNGRTTGSKDIVFVALK
ncbi:MAG: class I SAM-dependent methyltransferase [Bacillota bacterium]